MHLFLLEDFGLKSGSSGSRIITDAPLPQDSAPAMESSRVENGDFLVWFSSLHFLVFGYFYIAYDAYNILLMRRWIL